MNTKAVRIHGKMDLRLDDVALPDIGPDGVRIRVVSDSLCMSSYKAAIEGGDHKRIPDNCHENPTVLGHEFCGDIVEVGENWKHKYKPGDKFVIQPAHYHKGSQMAPGYSYEFCGGDAQYGNVPIETLLENCLLPYESDTYYFGSLAEPLSCVIGTFHAMYHTKPGSYVHEMGIKEESVLYINIGENITDSPSSSPLSGFDPMSMSVTESLPLLKVLSAIEQAASDDNIKGICIYTDGGAVISTASIEELRNALNRFKQSGKFIVAYDYDYSQTDYYIASVADKIVLNPEGSLDWYGCATTLMFYKGAFDKLGIGVEIFRPSSCASPDSSYHQSESQKQGCIDNLCCRGCLCYSGFSFCCSSKLCPFT